MGISAQSLQVKSQIAGRLETLLGIFLQTSIDNPGQGWRDLRTTRAQLGGIFLQNGAGSVGRRRAGKSPLSGEGFAENDPEAENVRSGVCFLSPDLLGRHITSRTQDNAGTRLLDSA